MTAPIEPHRIAIQMNNGFPAMPPKVVALVLVTAAIVGNTRANQEYGDRVHPRHCFGGAKHIHLAVGRDPAHEMTISFASKWSAPDVIAPIAGVHVGLKPNQLDRFVPEQEYPTEYQSTLPDGTTYYAPYQHHIEIDNLEPYTTYYYVPVVGDREEEGIERLEKRPLRDHPTQHLENLEKEDYVVNREGDRQEDEEDAERQRRNRRLAPPSYDGAEKPCIQGHRVRSFRTAPGTRDTPVSFAIIGDLGEFEHSQETLDHLRDHKRGIDAVILAGDVAYTEYDHRRWDTFFDFLDDFSIFDEVPLHVATGNHDIEKQENGNEIFQAYEARFRMPQIRPAERGVFDFPGLLNMDAPSYPLPYDWGNAYYSFDYGPAKHIIVSAYSSMEPESAQYKWLVRELKSVDRVVTPWVLLTIHTPLYNTFDRHKHDPQIIAAREHVEPLLVKYHVNVVFTGHIHAYQRTGNVASGKMHHKGPIHITIGAGGRQCDAAYIDETPEEWIEKRDASYFGYGRISIINNTHAEWRWIPLSISDKHPFNTVKGQEDAPLSALMFDEIVMENQFFLKD